MAKWRKLLDGMRGSPAGDWTISNLETLARRVRIESRWNDGSHCTFSHRCTETILTVPARRPIKPVYVRKFVELVDLVLNAQPLDDDGDD